MRVIKGEFALKTEFERIGYIFLKTNKIKFQYLHRLAILFHEYFVN